MTMVARFRVATRASGRRGQVYVHVYDDQQQVARAHTEARGREYDPADDIDGGMVTQTSSGFSWPAPAPDPVLVIRLWTGQLTTRTIAHEATHAGAVSYFLDAPPGWDSRARGILLGNHEPIAYAVGDMTSDVIAALCRRRLLT
ncbi:hypothetical protein FHW23_000191 [Curtobacterium pusillum]|uniref:Uncharacterized protein n=1 Tax=Curtobacterium pusillum TaxID=69373 RepID=A0AAW3T1D0_9MICO|nr:hypothetical protein [Curtobacterium pusillum]MBA8988959.1 hypothetical protein [Curtobacterium pusillum]